jgi:sulfoxide reductase catalytic subunit YedY
MPVLLRKPWQLPERELTPEKFFRERRQLIKSAGLVGLGAAAGIISACGPADDAARIGAQEQPSGIDLYPAQRNRQFLLDRNAASLTTHPWQVEIAGLVAEPRRFDIDELVRSVALEERHYRFRCVEAWAMAVPWTGFPLAALIKKIAPLSSAKFVRFVTFFKPDQASNQSPSTGPWPYTEALTMAEAMNELTLLATGIYGHPLPKQHGAPLRLVVPWKYGFKSIKSIVKIEFTAERPATFWHSNRPSEYDFTANVDPNTPHPRWSQATEKLIDTGGRLATLPYNGYGEWVAELYKKT